MEQSELDSILEELKGTGEPGPDAVVASVTGTVLSKNCVLIKVDGRTVGAREAAIVFGRIRELAVGADQHLILDLFDCPFLSSLVLGELSRIILDKRTQGRKVCVIGANEIMRSLFELTGLDQFLLICESREDALRLLESDSEGG